MSISVCLCLYVYICLCVCVSVWAVMHRHMCVHAYGIQRPTLGIIPQAPPPSLFKQKLTKQAKLAEKWAPEVLCLCRLKTGWDYKNAPLYLTFKIITLKVSLGIKLMFLGLQTKHLINWTISPALSTVSCHSSTRDGHHLIEVRSILMKISFTLLNI